MKATWATGPWREWGCPPGHLLMKSVKKLAAAPLAPRMCTNAGYLGHGSLEGMGVSPLAMMSMHEQYPWMKEKKSVRKGQIPGI